LFSENDRQRGFGSFLISSACWRRNSFRIGCKHARFYRIGFFVQARGEIYLRSRIVRKRIKRRHFQISVFLQHFCQGGRAPLCSTSVQDLDIGISCLGQTVRRLFRSRGLVFLCFFRFILFYLRSFGSFILLQLSDRGGTFLFLCRFPA